MDKRWTREELIAELDTTWVQYPLRLAALPPTEQRQFAERQGCPRPQDVLAHVGAWFEEAARVLPYLQRDERPPRDYADDDQFNARVLQRFETATADEVAAWYEQQRSGLKQRLIDLPSEAFTSRRLYRWLVGTLVDHYAEHALPPDAPPYQEK